jgi:hypothetical protein
MDDKSKVNLDLAVAFGGRGRRSILPTDVQSIAGDHDFKIVSLTPSVTLWVEVKPDEGDDMTSYYRGVPVFLLLSFLVDICTPKTISAFVFFIGEANATVKCAIFQASSPIRHPAELLAINKRVEMKPDVLVMAFIDGGPDRNISFLNVMISWLAYFIANGCDSLVVARTTPTQSWTNPAKRLMSVINLVLYNFALKLARELMDDELKKNMKKCNNMSSVRKLAETMEASAVGVATNVAAFLHILLRLPPMWYLIPQL